ncbi:hypothetical protein [Cellulomonas palmilytica]|uniref:hypothetical protein n=1 Tax=Cellulomonas palmilytica TaxID=2608402 RepID=UPI001F39C0CE|nr:hypothetical protein [Cellulomonas palmilytica]UJP39314.1 hypothetical protein F1D97_13340 [Cellulomonas palmilytica]
MTLRTWFALGEPGLYLTTSETGNTGDGGDPPFTVVTPSNTAGIQYVDDVPNPVTERTVIRYEGTGTALETRKTTPAVSRGAWQLMFRVMALPSSLTVMGAMRGASTGNIEARLTSANTPTLNANGTTFDTVPYTLVPEDELYVWDIWNENGTTTADGKAKHKFRRVEDDGSLTVLHDGALFTDKNTGITTFDSFRIGKTTASSTLILDLIQWSIDDGRADYCPDPVTGICGSDQVQAPWGEGVLAATGRGEWTQLAGPPVTLLGSGKTVTYRVPARNSGATLTFGYGGDTCTNTALPVTDHLGPGTAPRPMRLRSGRSLRAAGVIA